VSLGGAQTATIYRFVTADSQTVRCSPSCDNDSRRVTVAIVPSYTGTSTDVAGPFYLSTVITNGVPSSSVSGGNGLELGLPL
jgi:hypothetical protein